MLNQKLYPFSPFTKEEILKCTTNVVVNEDIWIKLISSLRFLIKIIEKINNRFKLKLVRVSFFEWEWFLRLIVVILFIDNLLYFDICNFNAFIDDTKPLILIENVE